MGLLDSILDAFSQSTDDKGCDWYCDNCSILMNHQTGFTTSSDEWTCTECGYLNDVSNNNIWNDDYHENDEECEEKLNVYDAALIWASNGKDEDYTFGYSEEELEDAL